MLELPRPPTYKARDLEGKQEGRQTHLSLFLAQIPSLARAQSAEYGRLDHENPILAQIIWHTPCCDLLGNPHGVARLEMSVQRGERDATRGAIGTGALGEARVASNAPFVVALVRVGFGSRLAASV